MPKLTDEQLFIKEPYRSIIYLFFKKDKLLKGLTAADFLKEINIKNSDALDKCLKVLIRRKWIKPEGKTKYYRYFITPFFFAEDMKRNIKNNLDLYDENIIVDYVFNKRMQSKGLDNKPILGNKKSTWVLFGLPSELIEYFTLEDKIILNNNIKNITKNLEEIEDMKLKYIKKEITDKEEEKLDIKTLFCLYNISFYCHCTSLLSISEGTVLKNLKNLLKNSTNHNVTEQNILKK